MENLPNLKLIDEGDNHYMVENAKGVQFAIAKKELNEQNKKVITSLPKAVNKEDQVQ